MAATILGAQELKLKVPTVFSQIEAIFWETSARKAFASDDEKIHFRARYLDTYLTQYSEHVFVAALGERVLGYILGVPETLKATDILKSSPHLEIFEDLYERYPAHLHINLTADARGTGLGGELLQAFERHLSALQVKGVHLITAATARNVSFYLKNHYTHRVERLWDGRPLLLLGKQLS